MGIPGPDGPSEALLDLVHYVVAGDLGDYGGGRDHRIGEIRLVLTYHKGPAGQEVLYPPAEPLFDHVRGINEDLIGAQPLDENGEVLHLQ